MRIEALLFDVGGVFLVPDGGVVGEALTAAEIPFDTPSFVRAHFVGVAAIETGDGPLENKEQYLRGYVDGLGVRASHHDRAVDTLLPLWNEPSINLWRGVLTESVGELRRLAETGMPLGIVSNADGTVEEQLRTHEICQLGEGLGVPVLAIVDSFHVGVSKPDAEVFTSALEALGVPSATVGYVGDTVRYDVQGARSAGLIPIHHDPYELCEQRHDHVHVSSLRDLWPLLTR